MNTTLSICIPTYNRKNYLKQCLEIMLPQADKFQIPIFISDNASEDGTEKMIKNISSKYPLLFYKRREKNAGIDVNMLDVINLSHSKYAWWFGDDDILVDGGIQYLLEMLDKNRDLSLILLNAMYISGDLKKEQNKTTIRIKEDTFYDDCRIFFKDHCFHMPFGTLITNTSKFQGLDFTGFVGTSHAYSGVVFEYLAREFSEIGENNIMVIAKPPIYLRQGKKTWLNYSAKIMLIEIPKWFDKLDRVYYPEAQKIKQSYLIKQSKLRYLLNHRGSSQISFSNLNCLTKNLTFRGKINSILVSLLPVKFAKVVSNFIKICVNLIRPLLRRNHV